MARPLGAPRTPRAYRCCCGRQVFFRNSRCLGCRAELGYVPSRLALQALSGPDAGGSSTATSWRLAEQPDGPALRRCDNFASPAACNWLIEPGDRPGVRLCRACRLNRTIPDLSVAGNATLWLRMERAKRRLVSQLIGLGLPVASRVMEDPQQGLAYDFLRSVPGRPPVMTGHHNGIITIQLEEADDAVRERMRVQMGEPYRTLLGHFRHEIGHYYWDRLVRGTAWHAPCREVFGDERRDYAAALRAHYAKGPPADWPQRFVSPYASMHPWEDWAESFAHYLHLHDTIDTAASFGIDPGRVDIETAPWGEDALWSRHDPTRLAFLDMLNAWMRMTRVMNEMSSAMGQHDFYPFVLPRAAVAKLHVIHCLVTGVAPPRPAEATARGAA